MAQGMGCQELFVRLGDDEVVVVDCREPQDWERFEVHVPGALRMSLFELDSAFGVLPDDELIVLCGIAADGSDARQACRFLQLQGRHAVWLEGGLGAWLAAGYPTEHHDSMSGATPSWP